MGARSGRRAARNSCSILASCDWSSASGSAATSSAEKAERVSGLGDGQGQGPCVQTGFDADHGIVDHQDRIRRFESEQLGGPPVHPGSGPAGRPIVGADEDVGV